MCNDSTFFTKTQEPYRFLLERNEWKAKRAKILARDNYRCTRCGAKEGEGVQLNVHHLHYINGLDPWEYKDSELITLCEDCHHELHTNSEVPVYRLRGSDLVKVNLTPCYRCNGAGWFPEYEHVQGGICFRCHGEMYEEYIEVVENYAKEHNIDMKEIDDGFLPLNPKIDTIGTIQQARINKAQHGDRLYVQLIFNNGLIRPCCLDYSVEANPGDYLDTGNLKYRCAIKKNGESYIIVKGSIMNPGVA